VEQEYSKTYLKLTFMFVIMTTAFPFLIISVSNVSIIRAIYKKRRLVEHYKKKNPERSERLVKFRRVAFRKNKDELRNITLGPNRNDMNFEISTESPWSGIYHQLSRNCFS